MKKLLRFYVYLKPSLKPLIAAILFGVLYGASSGFGMPVIIKVVLSKIFEDQDKNIQHPVYYILGIALLIPAVFAVRAVTGYLSGYLMTFSALETLRRLKREIFTKIQSYPIAFFEKFTSGDLLTRVTNDTASVQVVLLSFASEIFRQPLQTVGAVCYLIYLCFTNGQITILFVFFAAVPFCILPVQMIRKNMKRYAREAQSGLSEMAQTFNENLDAVHEVRVFSLQDRQIKKFDEQNLSFKNLCLNIARYELLQQPFMEVLAAVLVAVTFVYSYYAKIDFPTFASIGIALYFTIDPVKRIMRMASDFFKTLPLMERLLEIIDYKTTVPESENPVALKSARGDIVFENVDFAYKDKIVLVGANIHIPAGTSCALVGESGAGKSTFAKLAMRLYDPTSGSIKFDGIDLKDISKKDFVDNLGSVPQYPVLFNDTIFNNIALAKEGATAEEVYAAARAAYAHDFIMELENGYDTMVGERGDRLSGGQKQRIAIARIFLKNPPFIVLDEATSALDVNSEAFIQQAIDKLMRDRTMLIIAHRFSTIKNVQKIIVFEAGRIVDFGTHDELMKRCENYKRLYLRQMAKIDK